MAVLDNADRIEVAARIMRQWNRADLGTIGITAAQLLTMVGDLDAWIDANSAAANAAIQQPARGATTAKVKAIVLREVLATRYIKS